MKIAFTSCFDVLDDNTQSVWREVSKQHPDVLLLLGDSIYMDYGFKFMSDHPLGKPRGWGPGKFASEMYRRYKAQSEVSSFRSVVESVSHVGAIWDDHDFAWNNSSGVGNHKTNGKNVVPHDKKLISRSLHMQFRQWLRTRPLPGEYPEQPSMDEMLNGHDTGIEERFDIGSVRFIMLDGRYYREEKNIPTSDPMDNFSGDFDDIEEDLEPTNLLGENQRSWLANEISNWPGLNIICSGTTLGGKNDDAWIRYLDLEWLENRHFNNAIILSGDIHDIKMPRKKKLGDIWEFTASGAARPKFGDSGNFGIVNINDQSSPMNFEVELYDEDGMDKKKTIALG